MNTPSIREQLAADDTEALRYAGLENASHAEQQEFLERRVYFLGRRTGTAQPKPKKADRPGPAPLKRTPMRRAPVSLPANKTIAGMPWPAGFMKESQFQAQVERDAHTLGWMASHSHLPYFDTAGWPDLALVHPTKHRFMVRELKVTSEKGRVGKPSPEQSRWIAALALAGVDVGVWVWPHDRDRYIEELSA